MARQLSASLLVPARSLVPALVLAVGAVALVPACGSERTGGPRGAPEAVVRGAPDRTFAQRRARVEAAAPDAGSRGAVRFDRPQPLLPVTPPGAPAYPELTRPLGLVDLVRGAFRVVSYGGVEVRGVSTFRYEVLVNVERAVEAAPGDRRGDVEGFLRALGRAPFYADVWIDAQGRVRRIQVPVDKTTRRPATRDRRPPRLITVDLFDFGPAGR